MSSAHRAKLLTGVPVDKIGKQKEVFREVFLTKDLTIIIEISGNEDSVKH